MVGLYYLLHITKQRNKNSLLRLLPAVKETYNDTAFTDIFLHLFTSNLTLLSEEFVSEDFCSHIFDGFFLVALTKKENIHRHVLRLLLHLHHKVAPSKLESLQKALEPTKTSGDPVKELYTQLSDKLQQKKPSPPATEPEPAAMELPLHNMPTPPVV
ncbi:negative elongation factor B-like [Anomaloglossus baeobatrachus]|uniref:negative elongation factor B-like n=1 Tax=Anomaloglossus baeobatrachus TaxID=238106 RepID=UPI003F50B90B